jgi:hypothetical protein
MEFALSELGTTTAQSVYAKATLLPGSGLELTRNTIACDFSVGSLSGLRYKFTEGEIPSVERRGMILFGGREPAWKQPLKGRL